MGCVFGPKTTRAAVHETSNPETSRAGANVRVLFESEARLLARLAFWGARRAIPAARGPETESWPSNVVLVGAPRQYYSLEIA